MCKHSLTALLLLILTCVISNIAQAGRGTFQAGMCTDKKGHTWTPPTACTDYINKTKNANPCGNDCGENGNGRECGTGARCNPCGYCLPNVNAQTKKKVDVIATEQECNMVMKDEILCKCPTQNGSIVRNIECDKSQKEVQIQLDCAEAPDNVTCSCEKLGVSVVSRTECLEQAREPEVKESHDRSRSKTGKESDHVGETVSPDPSQATKPR